MSGQVAMMSTIQEKVNARIKDVFMDLLPPEMFEKMVKASLDNFMEKDLPELVKAEASKRFQELLKEEFRKPEWQNSWFYDSSGQSNGQTSKLVAELLEQAAPHFVAAMFSGVAARMMDALRNNRIY